MSSSTARLSASGVLALGLVLAGGGLHAQVAVPVFTRNASVHDPALLRAPDGYYVFGSHLASARSTDLMAWTQLSSSPAPGNPLAADPATTFAEAIAWIGGDLNFWAPDVHRLGNGKYLLYYSLCEGSTPRGVIGLASADAPGGPYVDQGLLLKSGMWGEISPDGTLYDSARHPNAVDPDVFEDAQGRLWMVYGSYSGGIFILRLDPVTGRPLAGQGYGKKLVGGNHARIEAPCILHDPSTGYYYLFLSFGGLDSDGGYQVRVARSSNPDGPVFDPAGVNMANVGGPAGSFFDDAAIAPHGAKLIGNHQFNRVAGEPVAVARGYLSPGHNSAYRDPATGRSYLIFHTRFVGRGEQHEVRVHRLHFNAQGWPVVAPQRYAGEVEPTFAAAQIPGRYKLVNHGKDISADLHASSLVTLAADGTVTGDANGAWSLDAGNLATLTLERVVYRGVFTRQWDDDSRVWVRAFSALSAGGVAVWGSEVASPNAPPVLASQADATAVRGETWRRTVFASEGDYAQSVAYSLTAAPPGATIDAGTGEIAWTPSLAGRRRVPPIHRAGDRQRRRAAFRRGGVRGVGRLPDGREPRRPGVHRARRLRFARRRGSFHRSDRAVARHGRGRAGQRSAAQLEHGGHGRARADHDAVRLQRGCRTRGQSQRGSRPRGAGLHRNAGLRGDGAVLAFARARIRGPGGALRGHGWNGVDEGGRDCFRHRAGGVCGAHPRRNGQRCAFRGRPHSRRWIDRDHPANGRRLALLGGRDGAAAVDRGRAERADFPGQHGRTLRGGLRHHSAQRRPQDGGVGGVHRLGGHRSDAAGDMAETVFRGRVPDRRGGRRGGSGRRWIAQSARVCAERRSHDGRWRAAAGRGLAADARLTLAFDRIADPALTYVVEAADQVNGTWAAIWTSVGAANTAGRVTVTDAVALNAGGTSRFLRLRVSR